MERISSHISAIATTSHVVQDLFGIYWLANVLVAQVCTALNRVRHSLHILLCSSDVREPSVSYKPAVIHIERTFLRKIVARCSDEEAETRILR